MALPKICTHNRGLPAGRQGFTLIEILVVIGLLTFVGGFTLIVSMDSFRGYSFRSERTMLVAVLQKARSQAVNNMCFGAGCTDGKPHGVHIAAGSYTIFQGASYVAGDPLNEVVVPQSKAIALSGTTDVVFTELSGAATTLPAGIEGIRIKDTTGKDSSLVTINAEGRICSDDASC